MQVGETKTVGFQFGVRKTVRVHFDEVWEFMFSEEGVNIWLGKLSKGAIPPVGTFETFSGIEGEVNVYKPLSHIRMSWKPKSWQNTATLQIRLIPIENRTTIAIHLENLANSEQRGEMKTYWTSVLNRLVDELTKDE